MTMVGTGKDRHCWERKKAIEQIKAREKGTLSREFKEEVISVRRDIQRIWVFSHNSTLSSVTTCCLDLEKIQILLWL